ncbi:1063_t:CDS:2 [Paraglomus occultum]|uniref:1063_t:CDS:1 n=1 Tax=Paraglomus occultum TaxID=144539 RepID=A0A9N9A276_9GLOM|nr:1063_t:CDS:2 [Paraglomus occultum]
MKKQSKTGKGTIRYGFAYENPAKSESRLFVPQELTRIILTPTHSKFIFIGTRHDILQWMLEHENINVEYVPMDEGLSPPLSPSTSSKSVKLTFDLFGQTLKNLNPAVSDKAIYKPKNCATDYLPWAEVLLEIRPTDPKKDAKETPLKRLVLKSGLSFYEISKALEKCWRNVIPDSFTRFLKPPPSVENASDAAPTEDVNPFYDWLARAKSTTIPTPDIAKKWQQKMSVIPPGVVTPYILENIATDDMVLTKPEEQRKQEKEREAMEERERAKLAEEFGEGSQLSLPDYQHSSEDPLLESGTTVGRSS